jgi:hypothetical protein
MRIKFIEKLRFKLAGRSVPVIKVMDVDDIGRVKAFQFIDSCKDRPNSIICTWDGTGWEKDREYGPIDVIDDKGILSKRWIVSESGKTVPLYTEVSTFPNREKPIGAKSLMDDASEAMMLHPSMREKMIWLALGLLGGWLFVSPIMAGIMS